MKSGGWLFFWGAVFYLGVGAIYFWFTGEPVGSAALLLTGGFAALIAFYVLFTQKRLGYQPEDNYQAEISEGENDYGFYAPHSWWPMIVAGAAGITFMGFVIVPWLFLMGLGFVIFGVTGWLFEFWKFERSEPIRH